MRKIIFTNSRASISVQEPQHLNSSPFSQNLPLSGETQIETEFYNLFQIRRKSSHVKKGIVVQTDGPCSKAEVYITRLNKNNYA